MWRRSAVAAAVARVGGGGGKMYCTTGVSNSQCYWIDVQQVFNCSTLTPPLGRCSTCLTPYNVDFGGGAGVEIGV